MATMIKEKRKEKKKKPKEKQGHTAYNLVDTEPTEIIDLPTTPTISDIMVSCEENPHKSLSVSTEEPSNTHETLGFEDTSQTSNEQSVMEPQERSLDPEETPCQSPEETGLPSKLENLNISYETSVSQSPIELLSSPVTLDPYTIPSAPVFDEELSSVEVLNFPEILDQIQPVEVKLECMPIDEAVRIFGGREMMEVLAMNEMEEVLVQGGPSAGPDHPLVDLLYSLRFSLNEVENVSRCLNKEYDEEESRRSRLWKLEKQKFNVSEKCACGADVHYSATYTKATFQQSELPAAKSKLQTLCRDVQESYCHQQHTALLTHYQIEELIYLTIKEGNKKAIREALSLILQELRLSDNSCASLCKMLRRWARGLVSALLDRRDLRHLLFLLQHLFRQTHSVRWAAKLISFAVTDISEAAQAIAVMGILLAGGRVADAHECTEETKMEEVWEEVDKHGSGAAVADGAMRERDLLSLLHTFPLADIVGRITLFRHQDISSTLPHEWHDSSGGHGVLKACSGVRTLLSTLHATVRIHAAYRRLRADCVQLAATAVWCLARLHDHCRRTYPPDMDRVITNELQAIFLSLLTLCTESSSVPRLPSRLLSDHMAAHLLSKLIEQIHDESISILNTRLCVSCNVVVYLLTNIAADRTTDVALATHVLEFLFEIGIKRKNSPCKGACEGAAKKNLAKLLEAHPYLYTVALTMLADLPQAQIESMISYFSVDKWRGSPEQVSSVLGAWTRRCPDAMYALLMQLDTTPTTGLSLESQLQVAACLRVYQHQLDVTPPWCWTVLRHLTLHRAYWGLPLEAPDPDSEPQGPFEDMLALLTTSWGHCLPLLCSVGAGCLRRLVVWGRVRDAAHCLPSVALVLAQSPHSTRYCTELQEVFKLVLESGPTLVARALGRPQPSGPLLLLNIITAQLSDPNKRRGIPASTILSVWLEALWQRTSISQQLLETVLNFCNDEETVEQFLDSLMQEGDTAQLLSSIVQSAREAPRICALSLERAHAVWWRRGSALADALHAQRTRREKAHVDRALQQVDPGRSSETLDIYRTATAILSTPASSPAQLALWKLFFRLYMQRPPADMRQTTPPVGPLYFAGILKGRTLGQLKKRLQEIIHYHENEDLKIAQEINAIHEEIRKSEKENSEEVVVEESKEKGVIPRLRIKIGDDFEESDSSESEDEATAALEDEEGRPIPERLAHLECLLDRQLFSTIFKGFCKDCVRCLEEGDRVREMPQFSAAVSDEMLKSAWKAEYNRAAVPPSLEDEVIIPVPGIEPATADNTDEPFHRAVKLIEEYRRKKRRPQKERKLYRPVVKTEVPNDQRGMLALIDQHLKTLQNIAKERQCQADRMTLLDCGLWDLVTSLRQPRALPAVRRQCPNKCRPITIQLQITEWCLSTTAEQGIAENRRMYRAALRKLCEPRVAAAAAASALICVIREVNDGSTAEKLLARLWQFGETTCAQQWSSVMSAVQDMCQKLLCPNCSLCSSFLRSWYRADVTLTPLRHSIAGALIHWQRQPDWHTLYITLLELPLPPHAAFSYLSKFQVRGLSSSVSDPQRQQLLGALVAAAKRLGVLQDSKYDVLTELISDHTAALLDPLSLCGVVTETASATARGQVQPSHWTHLLNAVSVHSREVPFDQLGHLLRTLGVVWWEVRNEPRERGTGGEARGTGGEARGEAGRGGAARAHAELLHVLTCAFVDAAYRHGYAVERVSWYAWSALQESWSVWLVPQRPLALLCTQRDNTHVIQSFCTTVRRVIDDCAGCEPFFLQEIFEWTVGIVTSNQGPSTPQENRIQLSSLLSGLLELPWREHQWFSPKVLQAMLQLVNCDEESQFWCRSITKSTSAAAMLHATPPEHLPAHLHTLLYVLCTLPVCEEMLSEGAQLPWWLLTTAAMEATLERFFCDRHSVSVPYHELPCFGLVLAACELSPAAPSEHFRRAEAVEKRSVAVSLWTRAVAAPTLANHVAAANQCLLTVLTDLAPHIESNHGEIESLLSRAITILCTEPAAAAAAPVWQARACAAPCCLQLSILSALATLTSFEPYAALAEPLIKAYIHERQPWAAAIGRWSGSHWREVTPLLSRGALHAAYLTALLHQGAPQIAGPPLYKPENEVILATWICYLCRIALRPPRNSDRRHVTNVTNTSDVTNITSEVTNVTSDITNVVSFEEVRSDAISCLTAWAVEHKGSLLRTLTLQSNSDRPSNKIRLLSRFALCILSPDCESLKLDYESTCKSVLPASHEEVKWAQTAHPKLLPRLAMRLFTEQEHYFSHELEMAVEDV